MTGADLLVKTLEQVGVEYMFGIAGGATEPLNAALYRNQSITPIVTKHEAGAAYMADGYSRISGKPGVCFSTAGPGASNLITGLATSYMDSIPVFAFTAQVATSLFGKGAFQDSGEEGVNIVNIFKNFTKFSRMMLNPERVPNTIHKMIQTALAPPKGPVHLSLPVDMMRKEISEPILPSPPDIGRNLFDRKSIEKSAAILLSARKPAILAGWGVGLSGGTGKLLELAELLNIPVATSPKAKGLFPESHQLSMGVLGFAGCAVAKEYIFGDVDVLIAVGVGFGEMTTSGWNPKLLPAEHLIHIEINPEKIGRNYKTSIGVAGDVKTVFNELISIIKQKAKAEKKILPPSFNFSELDNLKKKYMFTGPVIEHSGNLYHPCNLIKDIQKSFPGNTAYFVEIGAVMAWAIRYMIIDHPYSFFVPLGFGGMGYSTAACVGGQLAKPNRPVVCLAGDGGFLMHGLEVATAVEYNIPTIWIIFNNAMHGMIYHGLRSLSPPSPEGIPSRFKRGDFAKMGEGLGARGVTIEKSGGLTPELVQDIIKENRPAIIDIWIDEEPVPPFGSRIKTIDRHFG